jgi:hypothetical protein
MKSKDEKIEETPCLCEVHLRLDKERKSTLPCLGHGEGCPCYKKPEKVKVIDNPTIFF